MEKVRPCCGQPSDRGRLRNRIEHYETRSTKTVHCIPPSSHVLPVSRYGSGSESISGSMIRIATKINHLFTGPLPTTFPENFMQISSEVFAQSCYESNSQTDKQRRLHNLLGGGNYHLLCVTFTNSLSRAAQ